MAPTWHYEWQISMGVTMMSTRGSRGFRDMRSLSGPS